MPKPTANAGREARGPPRVAAAHAADAFVRMLDGAGEGKARTADLVIVQDLRAYRRGHAHPGEVCHIIGGGRSPVQCRPRARQRRLLKAVLHDGVNIHTVVHFGAAPARRAQHALELGAPPDFSTASPAQKLGCDRKYGLEWDHVDPSPTTGPPALETSNRSAGPTTTTKPHATAPPGSSKGAERNGHHEPELCYR